jgi:hypothetical protein
MSSAAPIVLSSPGSSNCSPESAVTSPPVIINRPSRLAGRRHHATSPAAMYGALIHS